MRANLYKMRVLDTYALIEIRNENPKFAYLLNKPFIIVDSTIAELYIVLMKDVGEEEARYWYKRFSFFCKPLDKDMMIKGLKFREINKKNNISIFDAFGYIFALENNYLFVTGDKEFKNRAGVEFIQK
jgi:predicted nucleic acid-binding protein